MPPAIRKPLPRVVLTAALTLLLTGCQATLFGAINATTRDSGINEQRGITFDAVHRLKLDVYAPKNPRNAPVVVFFYGGSWMSGKRQWYRWVGTALAQHGVVAIIPDYREYPEVRMHGFMTDAANAVAWAHANAGQFGGDIGYMYLMGHSAGGHIAALLATDSHWLQAVGLQAGKLAGFIGLAGPYDFLPLTSEDFLDIFGHDTASQRKSQPINFVDGDEPPMLLLQGTGDHTVKPSNAHSLAKIMREQHESVETHFYPGVGHIGLLLSLSRPLGNKTTALEDTLRFIHQQDLGATSPAGAVRGRDHHARSIPSD